MVAAVRRGMSQRAAARQWGVPVSTVQHWLRRAWRQRLDRVDWDDRSSRPKRAQRTKASLEARIVALRRRLQRGVLGEIGAAAIQRELLAERVAPCPTVRTIGRILLRHGVLDGRRRMRRPPPPKGWHVPAVAAHEAELDSFDTIEGLAIRGGSHLTILTGISLLGGLPAAWPRTSVAATTVLECLLEHWRTFGLPGFAQFDNDNRFTGPRQYPDAVGRVIRLCLSLGVTPVFAPPNETGFQAASESFNGLWQAKVWQRFEHPTVSRLRQRSNDYLAALRQRRAVRISEAPPRRPFPSRWKLDLQAPLRGRIFFIRRTTDTGHATVLGHSYLVDRQWPHRLVRAEVDLDHDRIQFFALRRRQHDDQPLLKTVDYKFPQKQFTE